MPGRLNDAAPTCGRLASKPPRVRGNGSSSRGCSICRPKRHSPGAGSGRLGTTASSSMAASMSKPPGPGLLSSTVLQAFLCCGQAAFWQSRLQNRARWHL